MGADAAAAQDSKIISELIELNRRGRRRELFQFRSRVGAHQYLRLYRLFRTRVPPPAHVLDWGAGNGHFSYFLSRAGYRVTGFGFEEPRFLEWLHDPAYSFVPGTPADPVTLPFPDGSFDAVASIGVLEHVRETGGDEAESLRELARVLKPGGMFVCYHLPNRHSWIEFVARRLPRVHRHRYRYERGQIDALVHAGGFELLETGRYAILPRNPGFLLPARLRYSAAIARAWDAVDDVAGRALAGIVQNHYFVARARRA